MRSASAETFGLIAPWGLMSIKSLLNPNPRFTQHLVQSRAFAKDPLVVVDVGARKGFESHWRLYSDQVSLIGFEADAEECRRLNEQLTDSYHKFYPVALHRDKGERPFFITGSHPASSGFYKPDMQFMKRFPDERNLVVTDIGELTTTDFDSFADNHGIGSVDFIKIDVEGATLDVLRGSLRALESSVWGMSIEVEFAAMHENEPLFADVDAFLRPLGFVLFDVTLNRIARKVLSPHAFSSVPSHTENGQLIFGQAVYLRDAQREIEFPNGSQIEWREANVLKLASFMELVRLNDCAIELLQFAQERGLLGIDDISSFIDLLVPIQDGRAIPYGEYVENLRYLVPKNKRMGTDRKAALARRLIPRPLRPLVRGSLRKPRDFLSRMLEL